MGISNLFLVSSDLIFFNMGMVLYVFGVAGLEVSANLYVMRCIKRRALSHFEPKRVVAVVIPLMIGPILGVYLESRVAHWTPFAISAAFSILSIIYFRYLGLNRLNLQHSTKTPNPWKNIFRFYHQPRLRLAWILTVARSSWWVVFVIYTPILMEISGRGELVGAAIVSIGTAWTFTVPFWGWVARRYGLRRLFQAGFTTTALISFAIYQCVDLGFDPTFLLIFCALGATILDGGGNVLFYRATRPFERAEMTGVFLSYRDISQLAPPGLFAVTLKFFSLPTVFVAASIWLCTAVYYSRHIPKRM